MDEITVTKGTTFGAAMQRQSEAQAPEVVPSNEAHAQTTTETQSAETEGVVVNAEGKIDTATPQPTLNATETSEEETFDTSPIVSFDILDAPKEDTAPVRLGTWEDEIKNVDITKVAEVLGLDPFVLELNKHLKNGGSALDYLTAKAIDYNKVSDADLLRKEFAEKYPHLDPSEQEYLFNKKYGISDYDDEDVQRDKMIALKADAYEVRQKKIAEQANFKIPDAKTQQSFAINEEALKAQQAEEQREQQKLQFIENHEVTKNLLNNKRVVVDLGEGTPPFNFQLDKPEAIMQIFSNGELWEKALSTKTGEPDVAKMQRIALAALNPNYEKSLVDYGKTLEKRRAAMEAKNAKKPTGAMPSTNEPEIRITNTNGRLGNYLK